MDHGTPALAPDTTTTPSVDAPTNATANAPADAPRRLGAFTAIEDVDLSAWRGTAAQRAALADQVRTVLHEVGFLQLVGHGLDDAFLAEHRQRVEDFFALPSEVKAAIDKSLSPWFRGWERIGSELTDNRVDHREQLDLSTEHPPHPTGATPAYLCLDGPNQWPADEALPGFRAGVEAWFSRCTAVADELMEVISVSLGLPPEHFHQLFGQRPLSLAKLISYPPTPPGEAGVNAHHDAGFLTLLLQHGVGGLQVRNALDEWIDVAPRDDAFVVNVGEMLQTMTGNYFVATTHRVVATQARFSSAYFHGPDLRTELAPLDLAPSFTDAVAASPWHRGAGFMAKREELLEGRNGTTSAPTATYGQQLWEYYRRSYPANLAAHHPHLADGAVRG